MMRSDICIFCGVRIGSGVKGGAYKKFKGQAAHWECFDYLKGLAANIQVNGNDMRLMAFTEVLDAFNIPRDLIYHQGVRLG